MSEDLLSSSNESPSLPPDSPPIAGVRLAPGAPITWCACVVPVERGLLVLVETDSGPAVGRVIFAPHQVLPPVEISPSARVLRIASAEERATWEAARYQPQAGLALAREIGWNASEREAHEPG